MALAILALQVGVIFFLVINLASLATWFERKASALIQDRVGANRAGAFVRPRDITYSFKEVIPQWAVKPTEFILAPILFFVRGAGILGVINTLLCDSIKAIFKEDFIPQGVSPFMHSLAPFLAVFPIFLAFAVIPFGPDFTLGGYLIQMQIARIDPGILFVFAMGSLAVYGPAIAGWTGNNKFSMLGGLRAGAQMISYELAMGLSLIAMVVIYGTLDLYAMVEAQGRANPLLPFLPNWGIISAPVAFVTLFIVGMAETKRAPFDLPEAESELSAGYFTEYSGMKFLLFWLGEFAEITLFAFIMALLFFGGWQIPYVELTPGSWVSSLIGHVVLMTKVVVLMLLQIIIRWTLPRFRYDQLMNLGWKILVPVSLVNLLVTAAVKVAWPG